MKLNIDTETVSYREVQVGNGNAIGHCGAHLRGGHCCEMDLGATVVPRGAAGRTKYSTESRQGPNGSYIEENINRADQRFAHSSDLSLCNTKNENRIMIKKQID